MTVSEGRGEPIFQRFAAKCDSKCLKLKDSFGVRSVPAMQRSHWGRYCLWLVLTTLRSFTMSPFVLIAQTINQGDGALATQMLESGTGFSQASNEVSRLIVQLKGELRRAA